MLEVTAGRAVARMALQSFHFNSVKVVHGGAVFTLADFAFAAACNSHGTVTLAINVSISLLRAVSDPEDVLTAVAEEEDLNPKISTCEVRVTNRAGELVALFHGQA